MLHPSKEDFPVDHSLPTHVTGHDADDHSVELYLAWDLAKWFTPLHTEKIPPIQEGDVLVLQAQKVYNAKTLSEEIKFKGVIKRDCDNLSKEEIIKHKKEVDQAKLEELKRWHDLKCFRRMLRSKARSGVDGTWALKWKIVRKDINGVSTWVKIIKARLAAR